MPLGLSDILLGGVVPLVAAAIVYAAIWAAARRSGAAWPAAVAIGYVAGFLALESRDNGAGAALGRIVRPQEAYEWTPLVALAATAPAVVAALVRRRWVEWLLAAPLCVFLPWRLLVAKHRALRQLQEAGFGDDAPTVGEATAILAALAAALLTAWWIWRRAEGASLPRSRSSLAVLAACGAALAAMLTGSISYGQAFGVLTAALAGGAAAAWALRGDSGPESASGPAILLFGGLVIMSAAYSELRIWQGVVLAVAYVLAAGWLPGMDRWRPSRHGVVRAGLVLGMLALVLWQAAATFIANEQERPADDGADYYRQYMTQ